MYLGSGIRKKPIPDPGSMGQKGIGSRIRICNTVKKMTLMRIRITLLRIRIRITLLRIRIQRLKSMWIHADPDPDIASWKKVKLDVTKIGASTKYRRQQYRLFNKI
jgi:hypothetical protein